MCLVIDDGDNYNTIIIGKIFVGKTFLQKKRFIIFLLNLVQILFYIVHNVLYIPVYYTDETFHLIYIIIYIRHST